ncbi:MAG: membrane dipeptidase, partial [Desulfofustis sp.]|nr:membrane dipeptidase [Desulfofustis sp.]
FDICNGFTNFLQLEEPMPAYDIISSHRQLPVFTGGLVARGYSDKEIKAILGGNFLRVYEQVIG